MGIQKTRRPVAGFRLDPEVLAAFQARLRERGMTMQPTLEAWVKRWLEESSPYPGDALAGIRQGQEEIRHLLLALARQESRDDMPPRADGKSDGFAK